MGAGAFPFVDPDGDSPPPAARYSLVEEEIYGTIRVHDEPVPGEVRLLPVVPDWPPRRAVTGEDLLYRLTYFGRQPFGPFRREGDDEGEPAERAGLHYFYRLAACDAAGRCRWLHPDSMLRGSGRLDLEIAGGTELTVEVVDADDGRPLPGVRVAVPAPGERLLFDDGDVEWEEREGSHAVSTTTDRQGRAVLSHLAGGRSWVAAERDGYVESVSEVRLRGGEPLVLRIELSEEPESAGGLRFVLPDGRRLEGGVLLGFGEEGRRLPCSASTDRHGGLEPLPDPCVPQRDSRSSTPRRPSHRSPPAGSSAAARSSSCRRHRGHLSA